MRESRKSLKLKARRALLGRYPAAVGMFILTEILCILFLAVMELGGVIILAILSPVLNEEMGFLTFLGFFGGHISVVFLPCASRVLQVLPEHLSGQGRGRLGYFPGICGGKILGNRSGDLSDLWPSHYT